LIHIHATHSSARRNGGQLWVVLISVVATCPWHAGCPVAVDGLEK
jgi:hypothetical protein